MPCTDVINGIRSGCQVVSDGINSIPRGINNGLKSISNGVHSGRTYVSNGIHRGYKSVTDGIHDGFQRAGNAASSACHKTSDAVAKFVYENSHALLYTGFCLTTAYLAPQLFFPTMIVTIILRIEVTRFLKELAEEYFKPEKNPMNGPPRPIITHVNLAMSTIAMLDSVALATFFTSSSIVINLLPMLGGVAAGNSFAKLIMQWANNRQAHHQNPLPQPPPPLNPNAPPVDG